MIRDATTDDFPVILGINQECEHFLSSLTPARLSHMHDEASYHRVFCIEGSVQAFLLGFREGAGYDSPNYLWFCARFAQFLYIDRVVVSPTAQAGRMGTMLYEDLFAYARRTAVGRITCEFDLQPPNPVSTRFHAKFGFQEIGRQRYGPANKTVSLQELLL